MKKEDGYVLPGVLIISSLVLFLLAALVNTIFFYNKLCLKKEENIKLKLTSYSALNKFLSDSALYNMAYYKEDINHVQASITKSKFGLYDNIEIQVTSLHDSSLYNYLIGYKLVDGSNTAITFTSPFFRGMVAGSTEIIGDLRATTDQIEKGNIFGIKQTNQVFLKGEIIVDQELSSKMFNESEIIEIINKAVIKQENLLKFSSISFTNEFDKTMSSGAEILITGNLFINEDLEIKNIRKIFVTGKVVIKKSLISKYGTEIFCDSILEVSNSSAVENFSIYSKASIIIKDSFLKNIQLYSCKDITLENTQANYPSTIAIYVDASDRYQYENVINVSSSIINGTIMLVSSSTGITENKSKIKIDEKSRVHGIIYCENNLELLGHVYGSIYTYNLWYYKEPTEYVNWMVNTKINRDKLDSWFLYPALIGKGFDLSVLKEVCIY